MGFQVNMTRVPDLTGVISPAREGTPTLPCVNCAKPATARGEIDNGQGYRSVVVCDHDCFDELMSRSGGMSSVRGRFPA